jgi:hypothetical protein
VPGRKVYKDVQVDYSEGEEGHSIGYDYENNIVI